MSDCDVCGLPGRPVKRNDGTSAGDACSTDCAVLVCFRWATTPDERRYEAWEWRKRTAEARGLPFDERPPPDVVDRWLSTWLAAKPALKSYLERKAA